MSTLRTLSCNQMRELDRQTVEDYGISGRVLMENAGRAVAGVVLRVLRAEKVSRAIRGSIGYDSAGNQTETPKTVEELEAWKEGLQKVDGPVGVICGRGNNGGDGFVIARTLINEGVQVITLALGKREDWDPAGDAGANLASLEHFGAPVIFAADSAAVETADPRLAECRVLIDAIFGTGLDREVEGVAKAAISLINRLDASTIAVDVPSGIDGDSGKVLGVAVRAIATVCLGAAKRGVAVDQGAAFAGEVSVEEIGIPQHLIREALAESRHD